MYDMQMIGFAGVSALALGAFILGKQSMARRKKMELQCYRECECCFAFWVGTCLIGFAAIEKGRETGKPPG